jgi:hypothetical protein
MTVLEAYSYARGPEAVEHLARRWGAWRHGDYPAERDLREWLRRFGWALCAGSRTKFSSPGRVVCGLRQWRYGDYPAERDLREWLRRFGWALCAGSRTEFSSPGRVVCRLRQWRYGDYPAERDLREWLWRFWGGRCARAVERSSHPRDEWCAACGSGGMGIRTPDLLIANETLYQLSYTPSHCVACKMQEKYSSLPVRGVAIKIFRAGGFPFRVRYAR